MNESKAPLTIKAFEGDASVGLQPEISTWAEAKEFCAFLETTLTAHREALSSLLEKWRERMGGYEEEMLESSEKGDTENQLAAAGVWGELKTCIQELEALARIQSILKTPQAEERK